MSKPCRNIILCGERRNGYRGCITTPAGLFQAVLAVVGQFKEGALWVHGYKYSALHCRQHYRRQCPKVGMRVKRRQVRGKLLLAAVGVELCSRYMGE